ncbi:hypothetical protein Y1Q_0017879 [Alligator mississippiensis]|uniref:Connexin N-terminal domain-containing protein n=1 Tax=Alligator mississippiensis TaxID=8496 RepID=A0A151MVQ0_ALLMI|nr:hypothetical protein Y1Q_0017879 [Alligator mississippiensis]
MAAAVVAGLARVLHPALGGAGASGQDGCQGLAPWYLLLGLRLVALFVADGPWPSAGPDLVCASAPGETEASRAFCTAVCFNQCFPAPIATAWGLGFLACLLPVGLMRLIRSQGRCQAPNVEAMDASKMAAIPEGEESPSEASKIAAQVGFNLAVLSEGEELPSKMATGRSKMAACPAVRSLAFGLCVALLLLVETVFLWVVLSLQLPAVTVASFRCQPDSVLCPLTLECALGRQADKQLALWTLASTSFLNMTACLIYGVLGLWRAARCQGR